VFHPLPPSKVFEDQLQMKKMGMKREKKRKKHKDKGDISAPSKVTHTEKNLTKETFKKTLFYEQPSYNLLCKGALTCTTSNLELKFLSPLEELLKEYVDVFP